LLYPDASYFPCYDQSDLEASFFIVAIILYFLNELVLGGFFDLELHICMDFHVMRVRIDAVFSF